MGRLGSGRGRKQYLELDGRTVLERSLEPFLDHAAIDWIVVALPGQDVQEPPLSLPPAVVVVAGGPTRRDSVRLGLEAVPPEADVVLIHDAARPLLRRVVVDRVLETAARGLGAVAAVPVHDTLKRTGADGRITGTVDRSDLWLAQTPQGFPREMIVEAHRRALEEGWEATDDASLVERTGQRVHVVDGDPRNLKVTRPQDLELAALFLSGGS